MPIAIILSSHRLFFYSSNKSNITFLFTTWAILCPLRQLNLQDTCRNAWLKSKFIYETIILQIRKSRSCIQIEFVYRVYTVQMLSATNLNEIVYICGKLCIVQNKQAKQNWSFLTDDQPIYHTHCVVYCIPVCSY